MPIICLFGPDGSGKSTLANNLAHRLEEGGVRTQVSWMRGTHTLASFLAKLLSKFSTFAGSDNPYHEISIPRGVRRLWQLIEFVSVLPVLVARFLLPNMFRLVIAERYLPDFVVWVALTTNDQGYLHSLEAKLLLALTLRCFARVYIVASPRILVQRRSDINQVSVERQLKLYETVGYAVDAYKLDTSDKPAEACASEVLRLVGSVRGTK